MNMPFQPESDNPSAAAVVGYLRGLQNAICAALEAIEAAAGGTARFQPDVWTREEGGGGESRVLSDGVIFERAGVNFSDIIGTKLPPAATAARPELIGRGYRAMGVSLVIHPRNPYVPTSHMNVRFLIAEKPGEEPIWWFGGGFDLTPYYGFDEDAQHWHRTAQAACAVAGPGVHARLKQQCDDYFYLKHRREPRGLGGLFYDDWTEGGFAASFALMQSVGNHFTQAYLPIVERRKDMAYGERERNWQLVRRGRYVEFNLVWDRGTLFGLQSNGRIESILMSMPPMVSWQYRHEPAPGSAEAALMTRYLVPADWL